MDANADKLNDLKKTVFYELLNMAGRVFIVVGYSENVSIGGRGFLPEEKENGLVLVFNTRMNFSWEEEGITVTLVFGSTPQKCFIPVEDITAIYSPEQQAQFIVSPRRYDAGTDMGEREDGDRSSQGRGGEKVVKVDFTKKKK